MVCCPLRRGLAAMLVYRVFEIVTAHGLVVSGQSPGCAVVSLFPSSTPIVDDLSGILDMARVSLGTMLRAGRLPTTIGASKL